MIDREKFNETYQYFDKEVLVEIIDIFLAEFPQRFGKIRSDAFNRDFESLHFNAHSLKGLIANFMDPVTIDLSRHFDDMAKARIEKGLDQTLEEFEKKTLLLIEELRSIRAELTA